MSSGCRKALATLALLSTLPIAAPGLGCKPKDELPPQKTSGDGAGVGIKIPPAENTAAPKPLPRVEGVDSSDDPTAPACLPRSYEVGEWVKRERIRVAAGGQIGRLLPGEDAADIGRFRVRRVALCAYAWITTAGTCLANVLVIETATPDDAYGMTTCRGAGGSELPIGALGRSVEKNGLHLHGWKASTYVHVWSEEPTLGCDAEMRRLLTSIAGRIVERAEPPRLLDALPTQGALAGRRWLARSLRSISADSFILRPAPDFERIDALLGLGTDAWIVVAAYQMPEGTAPNVVWIVQYPTADAARDAHARYTQYLAQADGPTWSATNLAPPQGVYLVGTWTAEEESLQYLIPRIQQLLPAE